MRRALAICCVILLAAFAGPGRASAAEQRLQVQSIDIARDGGVTRVALKLSRPGTFQLFTLTGPHRVVLDIASAALGPTALPLPNGAGTIRQLRVAHRPGGQLRVVFDMAEPVRPQGTLLEDGSVILNLELKPMSWVANKPAAVPPAVVAQVAPQAPVVEMAPKPPLPVPPAAPVPAPSVAAPPAPPPATVVQAPRRPGGRDVVVAVDAGHGGHDPGALGPTGLREKEVTLAISRRLVQFINAEEGMRAVLTRSDDRFVVLRQRMERARSANADLFISIHADAAYNRSARGSSVYVLSEKGATDEAARRLAARENAALIGGVELGNKDPVLASVLMDLSQNASISSSIGVGDSILQQMSSLGRLHRGTVQQAPFMVLKSPDVPSVLVETAFISNPQDERRLRSASHQEALARAILAGVRNYFRSNPPQGTVLAAAGSRVDASPDPLISEPDAAATIASR